ncbi:hypothetical protein WA026_013951 [Henosepilachna vigintioctopunctata]|uniref:Uncharacterized protein n=1 Tax=Henosepilachna vigintioctopunctata TaxID=420089 RepID=A0AAW1U9G0_9CUCU
MNLARVLGSEKPETCEDGAEEAKTRKTCLWISFFSEVLHITGDFIKIGNRSSTRDPHDVEGMFTCCTITVYNTYAWNNSDLQIFLTCETCMDIFYNFKSSYRLLKIDKFHIQNSNVGIHQCTLNFCGIMLCKATLPIYARKNIPAREEVNHQNNELP